MKLVCNVVKLAIIYYRFLLLALPSVLSLNVHILDNSTQTNAVLTLSSLYSTQSSYPSSPISANVTFLSFNDIHKCEILLGDVDIVGNIIVYVGAALPPFKECNTAQQGIVTAFSRIAQRRGALALVVPAAEPFADGAITGFGPYINIPVVVVPVITVQFLESHLDTITIIELLPIEQSEMDHINMLRATNEAWHILILLLYLISIHLLHL